MIIRTLFLVSSLLFTYCVKSEQSNPTIAACADDSIHACEEFSSGKKISSCGEKRVVDACPREGRVGKCVTATGSKEETTIWYYQKATENGRKECEETQKPLNGKYTPL